MKARWYFILAALAWVGLAGAAQSLSVTFPGPGGGAGTVPIATPVAIGTSFANSGAASITFSTTGAVPAGALLCLYSGSQGTAARTITSTGDGTNALALVIGQSETGAGVERGELWCLPNAAAVGSGATFTVNYNLGPNFGYVVTAFYVTGIITASATDKTAVGPGTIITSPTATTATLSQTNEIAICGFTTAVQTPSPAPTFTTISAQGNANGNAMNYLAYKIVAATTAVTCAPTIPVAAAEALVLATFKGN